MISRVMISNSKLVKMPLMQSLKKRLKEKTGARGLVTVLERTFRDFKFELPSTGIKSFGVDVETVMNPEDKMLDLIERNRDQVDDSMLAADVERALSKNLRRSMDSNFE